MGSIILGAFLVMMFLGVPIAFALGLAGALGIYLSPGGGDLLLVMPQEIFRILSSFPLLTIPLFIFAGTIMAGSGLGKRLIDLAQISVGRMPGGLGAAIVLASMFFSGVSGSATADTAAIGRVTIPALKNQGYPLPFGTALLAAAGGTAMLIPPSIDLIIIGIVANISIAGLFAAGLVPAVINGLALIALVGYVSWRRKYGFYTAVTLREALRVIVSAIPALVMIVIILGGILSGVFTPTESSAVAVIYALFVALFVYRDLKLSQIPEILRGTLELTGMVLLVISMGAILSYALTFNRIPHELAAALPAFTDSKIVFLLLVQIVFFLIGIVMDGTPALLILVPILTPIAVNTYGIEPIHFGILVEANVALGLVTPPVGLCLYAACAVSRLPLESVIRPLLPMIGVLVVTMLFITYVEGFAMTLPRWLGLVEP